MIYNKKIITIILTILILFIPMCKICQGAEIGSQFQNGIFINETESNINIVHPMTNENGVNGYFRNIIYYCDTTLDEALKSNEDRMYG